MRLNASGHHYLAGSIYDPLRLGQRRSMDRHDDYLLPLYPHVPIAHAHGCDNHPAPNDRIQHYVNLPRLILFPTAEAPDPTPPLDAPVGVSLKPTLAL